MKRLIYSDRGRSLAGTYRDNRIAERFCGSFPSARGAARRTLDG